MPSDDPRSERSGRLFSNLLASGSGWAPADGEAENNIGCVTRSLSRALIVIGVVRRLEVRCVRAPATDHVTSELDRVTWELGSWSNPDRMYRMDETPGNADLATLEPFLQAPLEATDESLVEAVRAGDDSAFELIYERHRRRVALMAGRFFSRPERVEEILQEVFTKVYFALGTYSAERGPSFAAWLSRVAINSCYDELRRARRRPESSIGDFTSEEVVWLSSHLKLQSSGRDAESAIISRDLANKLLARLRADDRLVLTLLDAEEMSVAEIAVIMGWKVSKVKVRAHRARQSLRSVLGEFV